MRIQTLFDTSKDQTRATLLAIGIVLLNLCVMSVLMLSSSVHVVKLVNLFYLGSAAGIGFWLYVSNPPLYLGFVWWMWFLSPFIRRLVDYQLDTFTPPKQALILLAPYVVTLISAFTLIRYGQLLLKKGGAPFLCGLVGVFYTFLVGVSKNGGVTAAIGLLEWLPPLLLGFHVYALWRIYPKHRQIIRSTFVSAGLVLGIYGIIQYFVLPPWDAFWMVGSGMNSIGQPVPLELRVFSMQEAPGAFASLIIPSLLLVFDSRTTLGKLSVIPAFISFLLTFVRSAWGGWMVGMAVLAWRSTGRLRIRLLAITTVAALVVVPVTLTSQMANRTTARVQTLGNLSEDGSLQHRQYMYQTYTIEALMNPIGAGLGSAGFDSAFVTVLWQAGWVGSAFYFGSLLWLLWLVLHTRPKEETDSFTIILSAVAVSYLALMVFSQIIGVLGCVLWSFMGLVMAGRRHDQFSSVDSPESTPAHA